MASTSSHISNEGNASLALLEPGIPFPSHLWPLNSSRGVEVLLIVQRRHNSMTAGEHRKAWSGGGGVNDL